ncbi:MAG: hypothetical protein LBP53_07135 [Candidatus Peribacteria bacterium]|jgi:hypothetical protein|nr:hypothetical protein [Candidatus Peribacteria bacterium]
MTSTPTKKQTLYLHLIAVCDQLEIARYLKNEVKNSLQYFHTYKLENIQKNLSAFTTYLLSLNEENCKQIRNLQYDTQSSVRALNNNISYFYHYAGINEEEKATIIQKIEHTAYQTISLMQGIKGLLLLTIDEFCNASPTRMAINAFLWKKEEKRRNTINSSPAGVGGM